MGKATPTASPRADRVWQRLKEWYGTRVSESYGAEMPSDWQQVIDATDNETVKRGLAVIRSKYTAHPPTLPQFEQAMSATKPASGEHKPSQAELLADFAVKRYGSRLTPEQLRGPWTYVGRRFDAVDISGKMIAGHGCEITGLVIDPDGDFPGYRITVEDMNAPDFTTPQ